jgi:AcrR family transcriptional regulator
MSERRTNTTNQILKAASTLFLRQGYRNVSVDLIATQAATTKVTVYQHFKSKEALILDCLALRIANREAALDAQFGGTTFTSPEVLLKVFDFMEASAKKTHFAGCAFTKAVNEMADTLPEVRRVAQQARTLLRGRLVALAIATSLREPESLGDGLATLLEGAQALSLIEHRTRPFKTARATAGELLTFHSWTEAQLDKMVKRTGGRHVDC